MKYEKALESLKAGKEIRRKKWKTSLLRLALKSTGKPSTKNFNESTHYFQFVDIHGNLFVFDTTKHPYRMDAEADDWEVVKEEIAGTAAEETKKAE
jgi:hypothetical protein